MRILTKNPISVSLAEQRLAAANDILNKIGAIEDFENVTGWHNYNSDRWVNYLRFDDNPAKFLCVEFRPATAEVAQYSVTTLN